MWTLRVQWKLQSIRQSEWGWGPTSVHSALRNQTVKEQKKTTPKRWNWLNLQPGSLFVCFFWKQHEKMKEAAEGSKTLSITDTGVSKGTGTGDCSDSPAQLRRGGGREGVLRIQKGTSRPSVDKNRACVERRKRVLISETTTRRLKLLWHMNGSKASASFPKKWKKKRLKWGHSHQPGRRVKTDFFF